MLQGRGRQGGRGRPGRLRGRHAVLPRLRVQRRCAPRRVEHRAGESSQWVVQLEARGWMDGTIGTGICGGDILTVVVPDSNEESL